MKPRAFFCLLATNILGGSSYVAVAYATQGFSAPATVFLRTLLAVILFLPFVLPGLKQLKLSRADWLRIAMVGCFGYALPLILGIEGQVRSSATNGALMIGVEPVSIVFLSSIFLGEKLTRLKVFAISCGLIGVVFIVLQGIPFINATITGSFYGDLLLFLHGLCWSLYSVIGKPVLGKVNPYQYTGLTTIFAFIPLTIYALPALSSGPPVPLQGAAIAGILYLGIGVSFLGTLTWNLGLDMVPASQLANFIFLQPVIGVLLGVFLQGESFSLWSAAGGLLVCVGVYAATRE